MNKQAFPYTQDGYKAAHAFYDSIKTDNKSIGTMKGKEGILVCWEDEDVQDIKEQIKQALIKYEEGGGYVYLDNAYSAVSDKISRHQFAGYLGALAKDGFYKETWDACFGQIKTSD